MTNYARRKAFSRLGETCPKAREAIHDAVRQALDDGLLIEGTDAQAMAHTLAEAAFDASVLKGTSPLRDALVDCEEEKLTLARELDDARDEVTSLKRRIDELENENADLTTRAEEAESRVTS